MKQYVADYISDGTWDRVWRLAQVNPPRNWTESYQKVFKEMFLLQPYDSYAFAKVIITCWKIWKTRNPNDIVAASAATLKDMNTRLQESGVLGSPETQNIIRWKPQSPNFVKLNFDGSVIQNSTAGGFVIRDSTGRSMVAATKGLGCTTIPVAEATAIRDGLVAAKQQGFTHVQADGDSKLNIDAVNGRVRPPWRVEKLIQDIRQLATFFSTAIFHHVYREANFVADALAHLGHGSRNVTTWTNRLLRSAAHASLFDVVNPGCSRGSVL